jgi:hypothetical protein
MRGLILLVVGCIEAVGTISARASPRPRSGSLAPLARGCFVAGLIKEVSSREYLGWKPLTSALNLDSEQPPFCVEVEDDPRLEEKRRIAPRFSTSDGDEVDVGRIGTRAVLDSDLHS